MLKNKFLLFFVLVLLIFTVACKDEVIEELEDRMVLVEAGENAGIIIEDDFYISKYDVTIGEFRELMGFNPSAIPQIAPDYEENYKHYDSFPIEHVSWYDAVIYANKLSEIADLEPYYNISEIERADDPLDWGGTTDNVIAAKVTENEGANGYRLPTVYEHMYASAGGKDGEPTAFAGSDDPIEVAWYMDTSEPMTNPVGTKEPNELGLYDMSGNLYNWTSTEDGYYKSELDDNYRNFARGGSFMVSDDFLEVNNKGISRRKFTYRAYIGFRLARDSQ